MSIELNPDDVRRINKIKGELQELFVENQIYIGKFDWANSDKTYKKIGVLIEELLDIKPRHIATGRSQRKATFTYRDEDENY